MIFLYAKCFVALLIGLVIHTYYNKYDEVNTLYTKSNAGSLSFLQFLKLKPMSHIVSFLACMVWMLILPDAIAALPKIKDSTHLANIAHVALCAIIGFGNSSFMLKVLGSGSKYVLNIIDKKTNIADGGQNAPTQP